MISRRSILGTIGASAVLGAIPALGSETGPERSTLRKRVTLDGQWDLRIRAKHWRTVGVPSSLHPIGFYGLNRTMVLPRLANGERAALPCSSKSGNNAVEVPLEVMRIHGASWRSN